MSEGTLRENLDKMHRWTFGTEGEFGKDVARELVQQVSDALAARADTSAHDAAILAAKAAAWDEGYWLGINGHTGPGNPYRDSGNTPPRAASIEQTEDGRG